MKINRIIYWGILVIVASCNKEETSPSLATCDAALYTICDGKGIGEYCTFGYKWGANNPFPNAGLEKPGPSSGQVNISYKFQDLGLIFNTHSQNNVTSLPFNQSITSCTKEQVKKAFAAWESVANVKFEEVLPSASSDIKIVIADINIDGIGYTAFPNLPCSELAGLLVLKKSSSITCESLYSLVLHETGHILGLGHINSNNVMNPNKSYSNLQSGDIYGIQTIYGKK